MVSTIHLNLHREAVRIRAWTDADGLLSVTLGQGLGELTLRLRPDSAAALVLALARALRVPADGGHGGADGGLPIARQLERLGRRERPAYGKEVLR